MITKMEMCTARGIANFPLIQPKLLASKHIQSINFKTQLPFSQKQVRFSAGLRYHINSSLRSTTSEETSAETTQYDSGESEPDGQIFVEDTRPDEKKENETQLNEMPQEGSLLDSLSKFLEDFDIKEGSLLDSLPLSKFLEDSDTKNHQDPTNAIYRAASCSRLDYGDTYSLLVLGGGGAVALWLAAAVVGAIDSIPVFPKFLELIGLGYTIWFSSRYLIFKESRDELVARIEQIKQEVIGSKDE